MDFFTFLFAALGLIILVTGIVTVQQGTVVVLTLFGDRKSVV
jgi:hypothetical protein